jgi:hypothetical protein
MNLAPPRPEMIVVAAALATVIWIILVGFNGDL